MEGLRDEMTWWHEAAQRNTHEEGKTSNKEEESKQSRKWLGVESRGYNGLLSLVSLLLCTPGNFPNENGKGASWAGSHLSSPILCEAQLMIKPSQERGTVQCFPSLKSIQKSLAKGHAEPSGKNRKWWLCGGSLCVLKRGAWKTGAGDLCSEARPPARGVMFRHWTGGSVPLSSWVWDHALQWRCLVVRILGF